VVNAETNEEVTGIRHIQIDIDPFDVSAIIIKGEIEVEVVTDRVVIDENT
jgi:hypothetical protein